MNVCSRLTSKEKVRKEESKERDEKEREHRDREKDRDHDSEPKEKLVRKEERWEDGESHDKRSKEKKEERSSAREERMYRVRISQLRSSSFSPTCFPTLVGKCSEVLRLLMLVISVVGRAVCGSSWIGRAVFL